MVRLHHLAHARAGDKGDISDITVIAYRRADYDRLRRDLTSETVGRHFAGVVRGTVDRYELSHLSALKFVLHAALGGGVTRSLSLDAHGKSFSSLLLELELPDDPAETETP